ncbi:MAG: trehalose-phosphatase [Candidatus Melainabacteria bacterium]|nr:trehalose-phosphatase [Candidatus Melainabacteria bacterium]
MSSIILNYWQQQPQGVLGLMLDYDGTLTPIVSQPEQAHLTQTQHDLLVRLCRLPNIRVAIVSGRSVEQLRGFLGPGFQGEALLLCGLHGGEIYALETGAYLLSATNNEHTAAAELFRQRLLARLESNLSQAPGWLPPGLLVEDKAQSVALHYRLANPTIKEQAVSIFYDCFNAQPTLSTHFRVQPGKEVLELVPQSYSKASAVGFLYNHWCVNGQATLKPCFIGDDLTDEDAFLAVHSYQGLSVCVGKTLAETHAKHTLANVQAVYEALSALTGN